MAGSFFTANELREIFGVTRQSINLWIIEEGLFPNATRLNVGKKRSPYIIPAEDVRSVVELKAAELEAKAKRIRDTFEEMATIE